MLVHEEEVTNMMRTMIVAGLSLCVAACASSKKHVEPSERERLEEKIDELESRLAELTNRIGHLQSEMSAASAENEFTRMTIDSVRWPGTDEVSQQCFSGGPWLLCHVSEWRDFGKMMRFTRKADSKFYLEAKGHPRIEATMSTGGICDSDGTTRFVMLRVGNPPEPGVEYRLRARNENDEYRWRLSPDLVVALEPDEGPHRREVHEHSRAAH